MLDRRHPNYTPTGGVWQAVIGFIDGFEWIQLSANGRCAILGQEYVRLICFAPSRGQEMATKISLEPRMIMIPAGEFSMGGGGDDDAKPQHRLSLPAFQISHYPVTNAQFLRFVEETGREWLWGTGPEWLGQVGRQWLWAAGRRPEKADCPVAAVSWHDARGYCAWLTETWRSQGVITPGQGVRLPTEAEWEKAARGADGRLYPWGDEWDAERCNTSESGRGETTPVDAYPQGASPYGLLDMVGNVWEWTASLWGEDFWQPTFRYPYDPGDGREDWAAGDHVLRVLRGGSYTNNWTLACCTVRNRDVPTLLNFAFGFRIVVT